MQECTVLRLDPLGVDRQTAIRHITERAGGCAPVVQIPPCEGVPLITSCLIRRIVVRSILIIRSKGSSVGNVRHGLEGTRDRGLQFIISRIIGTIHEGQGILNAIKIYIKVIGETGCLIPILIGIGIIIKIAILIHQRADSIPIGRVIGGIPRDALESVIFVGEVEPGSVCIDRVFQLITGLIGLLLVEINMPASFWGAAIEINGRGRAGRQEGIQEGRSGTAGLTVGSASLIPVILSRPGVIVVLQGGTVQAGHGFVEVPRLITIIAVAVSSRISGPGQIRIETFTGIVCSPATSRIRCIIPILRSEHTTSSIINCRPCRYRCSIAVGQIISIIISSIR